MRAWWRCLLCLALVAAGAGASAQPATRPTTDPTNGLAATLTQALQEQGLLPSDLTQPGADRRQGPGLFRRFMTAPKQAWVDVDALARLHEARAYPSEVLRALRQQVGFAENNLAEASTVTATTPATAPPPTPIPPGAIAVPPHIPQPLAGELQSALNALALAEAWRQHALRLLPADVSPSALLASALPSAALAGEIAPAGETSDHTSTPRHSSSWQALAPLVDQHALHTGARIALAAAERLHAFVTQSRELPAVQWRLDTPLGTVLVDTTGAHNQHVVDQPLLLLDVGGNDRYELGGHLAAPRPGIRLLLDHGGHDHYQARAPGAGPSSALLGYGILWDTEGNDQHFGGWLAQGATLLGVALHIDDAGHNLLQATGLAQGFAMGGTALLLGSPGDDRYRAQTLAQGSAGPHGLALLLDPAGNDHYHLGNEVLVWPSSQLPDRNASLGQGAAFGLAGLSDPPQATGHDSNQTTPPSPPPLRGGVAVLLDAAGHDLYQAQVFAQGAGLRGGTGLLLDQAGHNHFQAAWYAMGAAAHQGVGLLWTSGGGDDRYEVSHVTAMGAGHDEAVGMLVDAGGHDRFVLQDLGLGAAHDGGHGVLVRGPGSGRYRFTGTACRGMGQTHGSVPTPPGHGVFVDDTAQRHCKAAHHLKATP
jgi:hypothetical protein